MTATREFGPIYNLLRLLAGYAALAIIKRFDRTIPYKKQGFFCDDDEIAYPYFDDTVPFLMMDITYLITGIIVVTCVELSLIRHVTIRRNRRLCQGQCGPLHPAIYHIIFFLLTFFTAYQAADVVACFGKRTMSRPRPNFLAVCQPQPSCEPGSHVFISDYVCTGTVNDEYASFPSGHSAGAVSFAVIFIYYLHERCRLPQPIGPLIQLGTAIFAVFVCLSRVRDNKHRLTDVLAGAAVGASVSFFFVHCVLRGYREVRYKTEPAHVNSFDTRRVVPTVVVHGKIPLVPSQNSTTTSAYGSIGSSVESVQENR